MARAGAYVRRVGGSTLGVAIGPTSEGLFMAIGATSEGLFIAIGATSEGLFSIGPTEALFTMRGLAWVKVRVRVRVRVSLFTIRGVAWGLLRGCRGPRSRGTRAARRGPGGRLELNHGSGQDATSMDRRGGAKVVFGLGDPSCGGMVCWGSSAGNRFSVLLA